MGVAGTGQATCLTHEMPGAATLLAWQPTPHWLGPSVAPCHLNHLACPNHIWRHTQRSKWLRGQPPEEQRATGTGMATRMRQGRGRENSD